MIATEYRMLIKGAAFYEDRYARGDGRPVADLAHRLRPHLRGDDVAGRRAEPEVHRRTAGPPQPAPDRHADAFLEAVLRTIVRSWRAASGGSRGAVLTQPFADAVAEAERIITGAPHVRDRGRPGRRIRLPRGQHPGVAAARLGLPARLPVLRRLDRPVHEDGAGQPGHPVLPLLPARRRGVRGHRPPRQHHRPELPGAERRLLPRRGARQPDRVRRPGDRGRPRRHVRAAVRPGRPGSRTTSRSARGRRCSLVREVYSDWGAERRGTISIRRADRAGLRAAGVPDTATMAQALPGGGQDPAVPAADLPRLPGVVLPERCRSTR